MLQYSADESVTMGYPTDEAPPHPGMAPHQQRQPMGFMEPPRPGFAGEKRQPYKPNTELTETVKYIMFAYNLVFFVS